jgi:hypothetical protein
MSNPDEPGRSYAEALESREQDGAEQADRDAADVEAQRLAALRDLDALVALQKDTPEAAAARTAAAGRVIDKIEAERGAPVATLADRDFTEDQRLAVLRLLGGMPYSGNLFGVHNVRNLDDLLSWLRNYQRMLVEHSKDDDNREAEHRELVAMVNGARRWHALTTMPPGSPIGGAW